MQLELSLLYTSYYYLIVVHLDKYYLIIHCFFSSLNLLKAAYSRNYTPSKSIELIETPIIGYIYKYYLAYF